MGDLITADINSYSQNILKFQAAHKGPYILHISDTSTCLYGFIEAIISLVKPALIVHTGDLADEFKVGRCAEDFPGYKKSVEKLVSIMECAKCPVWITKGNNDDFSVLNGCDFIKILPNGSRISFMNISMEINHMAIPFAPSVDFALFGHGGNEDLHGQIPTVEENTQYLNGNFNWSVIDVATKEYLTLPCRAKGPVRRVFICRHGQTDTADFVNDDPDLPRADPILTPTGIMQAKYLAMELKSQRFNGLIISSPFRRALMTAEPIAEATGCPIYLAPEFREIAREKECLDKFNGFPLGELRKTFPAIAQDAVLPFPWWENTEETDSDVDVRVRHLIDRITGQSKDILFVGHGASCGAALRYFMELSGVCFNSFMPAPKDANCSLSEFRYSEGKYRVVMYNSISHIPAWLVTSNPLFALNKRETL